MEMNAYMREMHGNWFALDHSDQATKGLLGEKWQPRFSFPFAGFQVVSVVAYISPTFNLRACAWA